MADRNRIWTDMGKTSRKFSRPLRASKIISIEYCYPSIDNFFSNPMDTITHLYGDNEYSWIRLYSNVQEQPVQDRRGTWTGTGDMNFFDPSRCDMSRWHVTPADMWSSDFLSDG